LVRIHRQLVALWSLALPTIEDEDDDDDEYDRR